MTVAQYLDYIDDYLDKSGTAYFNTDEKLKRIKTMTYSFLEQNKEFIQFNQKAREDLGTLTRPYSINPTGSVFIMPTDFYGMSSMHSMFGDKLTVTPIVQSADWAKLNDDPFHTPTQEEPLAMFYNNRLEVKPLPDTVDGLYLKHPTFGVDDADELVLELPEQIQEFLLNKVASVLMTTSGDERVQLQYYSVENFS